jgi:hypothetical protein
MGIANTCRPVKVEGKVATKDTGKGCTLIYLVDKNGNAIANSGMIRIGNKTGHIYLEKNVGSALGFDTDYNGRLKVVTKLGKAVRCRR